MAGTVKSPLNKRQSKKFGVFNGIRNIDFRIVSTFLRHHAVKGDKHNPGHPLRGRVTEVYKYIPDPTGGEDIVQRHVVAAQDHPY